MREREAKILLMALAEEEKREHATEKTAAVKPITTRHHRAVTHGLQPVLGARVAPAHGATVHLLVFLIEIDAPALLPGHDFILALAQHAVAVEMEPALLTDALRRA